MKIKIKIMQKMFILFFFLLPFTFPTPVFLPSPPLLPHPTTIQDGFYDNKLSESENLRHQAVTDSYASGNRLIKLSGFKQPKIVNSFYYEDDPRNQGKQTVETINVERRDYYDPKNNIMGDKAICDSITTMLFCIKQNVCGWCKFSRTCVRKDMDMNFYCERNNYIYTANLQGYDPAFLEPAE